MICTIYVYIKTNYIFIKKKKKNNCKLKYFHFKIKFLSHLCYLYK